MRVGGEECEGVCVEVSGGESECGRDDCRMTG